MSRPPAHVRVPNYCLHKARNTAYVRLNGHVHYLPGRYGSPESRQEYDRLVGLWQLTGRQLPANPPACQTLVPVVSTPVPLSAAEVPTPEKYTIAEMCADYLAWAESYHIRDGQVTQEVNTIENALKPLLKLYGTTPLAGFGPKALKLVRQAFIDRGLVRGMVNKYVSHIKRAVKWMVSEEKVSGEVFHRLLSIDGLRRGRSEAPEGEPVRPVDDKVVAAFLPHLSQEIRAMIEIAQLTGMRPTEVCLMRASDIDMTQEVWAYRPMKHETSRFGIQRFIAIGPKAQAIIRPFLVGDPTEFLLSPAKAEKRRRKEATAARTTPKSCGNRPGTNRVANPSYSTCRRRLLEGEEHGVWLKVWRTLLAELDEQQRLDWEECFADGSFTPAKKGGSASERPNAARVQSGWWWQAAREFLWQPTSTRPRRAKPR